MLIPIHIFRKSAGREQRLESGERQDRSTEELIDPE